MSLTLFFKENVVSAYDEKKVVISDRFKDEEGNPIEWILRPLSPDSLLNASESATVKVGKSVDFKTSSYFKGIVTKSVVYPNLNDAELQNSYGVMGAEQLLNIMLNAREFQKLQDECNKINGLDKSFDDLKDEVKN